MALGSLPPAPPLPPPRTSRRPFVAETRGISVSVQGASGGRDGEWEGGCRRWSLCSSNFHSRKIASELPSTDVPANVPVVTCCGLWAYLPARSPPPIQYFTTCCSSSSAVVCPTPQQTNIPMLFLTIPCPHVMISIDKKYFTVP